MRALFPAQATFAALLNDKRLDRLEQVDTARSTLRQLAEVVDVAPEEHEYTLDRFILIIESIECDVLPSEHLAELLRDLLLEWSESFDAVSLIRFAIQSSIRITEHREQKACANSVSLAALLKGCARAAGLLSPGSSYAASAPPELLPCKIEDPDSADKSFAGLIADFNPSAVFVR